MGIYSSGLVALDATVRLRGPKGERIIPLAQFFALPENGRRRESTIAEDELLLALEISKPPTGTRSTYFKAMDRKVWAFALVGVAAMVQVTDGQVADARLVLSGVAPIPWRVTAAEQALIGAKLESVDLERIAATALADAEPLRHNQYKITLAQRLVQRALTSLLTV